MLLLLLDSLKYGIASVYLLAYLSCKATWAELHIDYTQHCLISTSDPVSSESVPILHAPSWPCISFSLRLDFRTLLGSSWVCFFLSPGAMLSHRSFVLQIEQVPRTEGLLLLYTVSSWGSSVSSCSMQPKTTFTSSLEIYFDNMFGDTWTRIGFPHL